MLEPALRRPTVINGTNRTDMPLSGGCLNKNCMKCGQWKLPLGFRKNPRTGMSECGQCTAERLKGKIHGHA